MGGAGADQLQGQGGRDTASYAEAGGGVFVRLWSGEGLSGEALGDVLTGSRTCAARASPTRWWATTA
jgi:hypothetical protein